MNEGISAALAGGQRDCKNVRQLWQALQCRPRKEPVFGKAATFRLWRGQKSARVGRSSGTVRNATEYQSKVSAVLRWKLTWLKGLSEKNTDDVIAEVPRSFWAVSWFQCDHDGGKSSFPSQDRTAKMPRGTPKSISRTVAERQTPHGGGVSVNRRCSDRHRYYLPSGASCGWISRRSWQRRSRSSRPSPLISASSISRGCNPG